MSIRRKTGVVGSYYSAAGRIIGYLLEKRDADQIPKVTFQLLLRCRDEQAHCILALGVCLRQ
jgi:hypothetical protein